jgi:hypothetical protein
LSEPLTHRPGDDPRWQESMAFIFGDERAGVGGTAAFGTFTGAGIGLTWLGLWAGVDPTAVFQRSRGDLPLQPDDRGDDRLGAGAVHYERLGPGWGRLDAVDTDAAAHLEFRDFYPLAAWGHDAGPLDRLAAGHLECSGAVTGEIVLGGRRVAVDGLGHRDHSWGPRATEIIRNHRWVAGTCGPELGFSLEALHLADGTIVSMGFVARDGNVTHAASVENLVTLDHDGLTPRGYESHVVLVTGEELTIASEYIHACLYNHRGALVAVDALARVRVGSHIGIADLNLIVNPHAGTAPPSRLLGGTLDDGLSTLGGDPTA